MKTMLLVLLLLRDCLATPTIEDNKIPTPQEILGQPEEVASLGLPSDEESFNRLSVFFNPAKQSSNVGSGTYHFVSSTFPEVDARGFHESVFDGIGDYFPSWPAPYKRDHNYPYATSLAQRLGLQPINRFRKRSEPPTVREKRFTIPGNDSQHVNLDQDLTHFDKERNCIECSNGSKTERVYSLSKRLNKRDVHAGEVLEDKESKAAPEMMDKRSGARYVRGMEMGSSGFHGDVFNGDFGDFTTMRKRARGSMGFHGDTFSDGFGDFSTMKRSLKQEKLLSQLKAYLLNLPNSEDELYEPSYDSSIPSSNEEIYDVDLNSNDVKEKRKPDMTSMGFYGDTFSGGFGDFYPVKKRRPEMDSMGFHGDTFSRGFGEFEPFKKRKAAGSMGFYGDTFSQGFGDFSTLKKRRPASGSMGFHGDTFSQGFGDFSTLKKRRPASGSMGFHGDTFSQGFGDFSTLKKRRPASGSMGFHGDTFSQGFGDFSTLKKRRPEMDSMGFHGDTFSRGFGEFEPFKKRRPEMDSMGFHGDTFSRGFGEFEPFRKRNVEMDSMGLNGNTLNRGFGDFDVHQKNTIPNQTFDEGKTEDQKCCTDSNIQRHQDVH